MTEFAVSPIAKIHILPLEDIIHKPFFLFTLSTQERPNSDYVCNMSENYKIEQ